MLPPLFMVQLSLTKFALAVAVAVAAAPPLVN